nr:hypothetical protein [Tanacetum cinerariifolium]
SVVCIEAPGGIFGVDVGHRKADSDGFEAVTFMVLSKATVRVEDAAGTINPDAVHLFERLSGGCPSGNWIFSPCAIWSRMWSATA